MKKTQEIAADFAVRAVNSINKQLGVELGRLQLLDMVKAKEAKLIRTVATSKEDDRFVNETYSVKFEYNKKPIERMVMNVNWNPSGFNIERYNEKMINAIVKSPDFKIKKGANVDFKAMSQFDIEVEALASKKMVEHNEKIAGLRKT